MLFLLRLLTCPASNLFERTPNETTIYLGPWDVIVGTDSRRVLWQCSYQGETLEQFRACKFPTYTRVGRRPYRRPDTKNIAIVPSGDPTNTHPLTLHARHRPYSDPGEMELFVTFMEPQRIRYTAADGRVIHDDLVEVKYEFTSVEGSLRFQGDLRRQDLADYFDVDVIFSDTHSRTDSLTGAVRGMATIQRMKLWRDRHSTYHYLTFYSSRPSNRQERRFRAYQVTNFEGELRQRDDRHRECRLNVRGRRGSAPDNNRPSRTFSISSPSSWTSSRHRQRSAGHVTQSDPSLSLNAPLDIRWLGIRFSRENGQFSCFFLPLAGTYLRYRETLD